MREPTTARRLQAFSAARRKDFRLARERFALLRKEAARLPDGGKQPERPGEKLPTLEQEGAYQHAVLTAALGEKSAAEREYLAFLREYPESPLVHAAVRRLAKLHGGNLPKEAQAAWKQAMEVQAVAEKSRLRDASLCGPEVVSEFLRRRRHFGLRNADFGLGKPPASNPHSAIPNPQSLMREMGTDERGTSLKAVAEALRRRGLTARGLRVTFAGVRSEVGGRKHDPTSHERTSNGPTIITLVQPGHYVLVEAVSAERVWVWDPAGGKPVKRSYPKAAWERLWSGVVLAVE